MSLDAVGRADLKKKKNRPGFRNFKIALALTATKYILFMYYPYLTFLH